MEIGGGEFVRHAVQHFVGRNDVEDGELRDAVGMIEGHAVRDASAAIVAHHRKFLKSQTGHHLDLVLGHGALGIVQVIFAVGGFAAVSVTAEIGRHNGKFFGELRSDVAPFDVRLRIAVQEKQRRPASRGDKVDRGARSFRCEAFEPGKKSGAGRSCSALAPTRWPEQSRRCSELRPS